MEIPRSVNKLMSGFHQDIFEIERTIEGATRNAAGFLSSQEIAEAKSFLDNLLRNASDATAIRMVWDALPKDIRLDRDEEVVEFLKQILAQL